MRKQNLPVEKKQQYAKTAYENKKKKIKEEKKELEELRKLKKDLES